MAFNQLLCTVLISLPYAAAVMPPAECFTPKIILSLVYLGVGSAGTGYLIYVRGVKYLGPTISSLFSNFLPVTSTFFGWLILGQSLGVMQIAGGLIVIVSACYVKNEKSCFYSEEASIETAFVLICKALEPVCNAACCTSFKCDVRYDYAYQYQQQRGRKKFDIREVVSEICQP